MSAKGERDLARWRGGGHGDPLAEQPGAERWLADALGLARLPPTPPKPLDRESLPPTRLTASQLAALAPCEVSIDPHARADRSLGWSYADLLVRRSGRVAVAVDGVARPRTAAEVQHVLAAAGSLGLKVIPSGGGSSVVGGLSPALARGTPVLGLDTTGLSRILTVEPRDLRATVEAGILGPALDAGLRPHGLVLGHTPQSFEGSTLGGWIAAAGSGQHSGRYGRPRDWLVSARVATPVGPWSTEDWPAGAAGPALASLLIGSEGAFGIVTQATVRLRPLPERIEDRGYVLASFEDGAELIRRARQSGLAPAMLRLSDEDETYFFRAFSEAQRAPGLKTRAAGAYLRWKGMPERFAFLTASFEGDATAVAAERAAIERLVKACGGVGAGSGPGRRWREGRYHGPYLRDALMDRGIGVETFETAAPWSALATVYREVRAATVAALAGVLPGPGARAAVLCHISHAYADGASLYFTVVFPRRLVAEHEQWPPVKAAAMAAIRAHGGTLSHHHGVGLEHRPWLEGEKGPIGMALLAAAKRALDPDGVLVSALTLTE